MIIMLIIILLIIIVDVEITIIRLRLDAKFVNSKYWKKTKKQQHVYSKNKCSFNYLTWNSLYCTFYLLSLNYFTIGHKSLDNCCHWLFKIHNGPIQMLQLNWYIYFSFY